MPFRTSLVLYLLILAAGPASAQEVLRDFQPLTQERLSRPDPADWIMWRGNYENWGYSPLSQIDRDNVQTLQLAWSWTFEPPLPGSNGMQVEPVVYDGVMYLRHANENYSAHDAATGDILWRYSRPLPEPIVGGQIRLTIGRGRGVFLYQDKLLAHSTDGMLFALDPRTGRLLWEVAMTDFRDGQQPSGAPVAFDGVVAIPYNCTAWTAPGPCHLSAYSTDDGELLWRWYTSPVRDDPMHFTWGDDPQVYPLESRRNMSPWMTPAVDSSRGLFIFGIGSSAPQQPDFAGTNGEWPDRLYQGSTVALDHRTGELVWWAQHHTDMWNNDSVFDRILVDSAVDPSPPGALGIASGIDTTIVRQLVIGSFSKDAIFYAYERSDGKFLYARPTAYQNLIQAYDGETGAYLTNSDAVIPADPDHEAMICRENRNIPQGAYSPLTNAYYAPVFNGRCGITKVRSMTPDLESGYNTSTIRTVPSPAGNLGQPEAIEVSTGRTLWRQERPLPLNGMLTTGGGLLFAGDANRRFYALDQWTGDTLWQTILSGATDMAPISFAVDGRQYIAVLAPSGTQDTPSHAAQNGIQVPTGGGNYSPTLFVFALPESR
ncbi:MAG: PQQ-binding-like beta-propeller repeat protein [Gammaproteobacteria bacterium]|nr:PQQ-binding-like beta-propeller repeat protein [Pseudomonadales bacterium]MCP5349263.1 PQQ-binding-like beta-propeller repeat protein [Pseudomonadales bacterium]